MNTKYRLPTHIRCLSNICLRLKYIKQRIAWRKKNPHNRTEIYYNTKLCNITLCDINKIEVGNYTYWPLDVREMYKDSFLQIWSFVSISAEVVFLLWNHNYKLLLQQMIPYKFHAKYFWIMSLWLKDDITPLELSELAHFSNWKTVIWDDVWIWTWAKIMSWVHIWQWAVIAAWAIVTKDIPPYAIAWWVPAKVIKYRFSNDIINELIKIDFSKIKIEEFYDLFPETSKEDFEVKKLVADFWVDVK